MITGDLKSKIDGLWEDFWVGGITNPLTVIEQITYLMYSRMLDTQEQRDEKRKQIAGIDFKRKRLARTVLIFTERSDQLSRATDRVPGLPA
ncbi:type I restriction-modification system subunit M N-terminal domain-containing protein, partial [Escherichia coli]|uniref:type I restriction-modification system subunit M N-terminal domain-containing protein n=1 Tax=Escherichia coli TaxID=562 RepID=UPI002264A8FE